MQIDFDKEIFNDVFLPLLNDQSRHLALKGGAGSGKSYFAIQKIMWRLFTEEDHRFLFVRKVGNTIRNSMYKLFKDLAIQYGVYGQFQFRDTEMNIRVPATNSEIICVGMDDREKLKSIADITGIWAEEVTELAERDFRQLNIRLRGVKQYYKQSIYTFNPIDTNHWIHAELFPPAIDEALEKKPIARWTKYVVVPDGNRKIKVPVTYTCCHTYYAHNRFLEFEEKAELEDLKNKDYRYWLVYAKGMWGTVGNLVFDPPWKIAERPREFDEVIYGLDFGYHHPNALVEIGIKDNVYYISERYYQKRETKPELLETLWKDALSENPQYIKDLNAPIYADSAEPDTIQDMENMGFNVIRSHKGNNSLKDSIDFLKAQTIFIDKDSTNLQRELRLMKWVEDKEGNPIEGKVHPYNDDLVAASRYGIYTHSRTVEVKVG